MRQTDDSQRADGPILIDAGKTMRVDVCMLNQLSEVHALLICPEHVWGALVAKRGLRSVG